MTQPDPYLPSDDTSRALAMALLQGVGYASLAVTDATTHSPNISRIAIARLKNGLVLTLISTLSAHTQALLHRPDCAFMVGEPGASGDPLSHPRLMVQARAAVLDRADPQHAALRAEWLRKHPKSKLYVDFADFRFVRLDPVKAVLNAGFGRAHRLHPADLMP